MSAAKLIGPFMLLAMLSGSDAVGYTLDSLRVRTGIVTSLEQHFPGSNWTGIDSVIRVALEARGVTVSNADFTEAPVFMEGVTLLLDLDVRHFADLEVLTISAELREAAQINRLPRAVYWVSTWADAEPFIAGESPVESASVALQELLSRLGGPTAFFRDLRQSDG